MKRLQFLALTLLIALILPTAYAQNTLQWGLPEGAKMRLGKGRVYAFQFSPDGTRLKVASASGIWHYDTQTGQEVDLIPFELGGFPAPKSTAFSPDGGTLAFEIWTGITLLDAGTGAYLTTLTGHTSHVMDIVFSPDGKTLASGGWDYTVRLWDVETGKSLKTLTEHTAPVRSVAFSPDGRTLASGSNDNTVRLWDVETGKLLKTLGHTDAVRSVTFSPDGRTLATGGWDQTIRLWDALNGTHLQTLVGHTSTIFIVAFSPDGRTLATGSDDDTIRLWDVLSGTHLQTLKWEGYQQWGTIAFSPDSEMLASGGDAGTTRLWNVRTGEPLKTLTRYTGRVQSLAFSPDGTTLAGGTSAGFAGKTYLWDVGTGELLKTFIGSRVAFSPDGRTLATGGWRNIRLWDVETGKLLKTLTGHTSWVHSMAFSPDGRTLATGDQDKTIYLWDMRTGASIKILTGHTYSVYSIAFSPDSRTLASSGGRKDNTIRLWDVGTGKPLKIRITHTTDFLGVAFSPDGRTLASSSSDGTIRLWDARSGQYKQTFPGTARPLVFSPDGGFLAAGLNLMDLTIGEAWEEPLGYHPSLECIAFNPDGTTLASGGFGGMIILWDVTSYTSQPSHSDVQHPQGDSTPEGARVSLSPASVWSANIGDQLTVNANITEGVDVRGYQLELTFDTAALRFVSSVDAGYLPAGAFQVPPVENVNRVTFGATSLQASSEGDGTLATFTFEVLAASPAMPTLTDVKLTDSNADFLAVRIGSAELIETGRVSEDVNGDGVVNIQDLVVVASSFGQTGQTAADVTADGIVNIIDLVKVAGAIGTVAAAPSMNDKSPDYNIQAHEMLTGAEVQRWLTQAQQLDVTDATVQKGIHFLEQLLEALAPTETALLPNYPNPFNPETWIPYHLSKPADVTISIYTAEGRLVRALILGHQGAGIYESRGRATYWDGRNALGEPVASGVYFYTLTAGDFSATRRMLILK